MFIPPAYMHVAHFFGGTGLPNGAAVTYGVGGLGFDNVETAAEELHDLFAVHIVPLLSSSVWLESTRVKQGPNSTGPFATWAQVHIGEGAADMAPPNTAVLVEKRTALGGRSGRGRLYLPGIAEVGVTSDGRILLADVPLWQAALDAWLTAIEATSTGMFVLHSSSSDPTAVTKLQIDPVVATQRRRLR